MGKPIICICVIKGTDQLRGNREADQCLCFLYMDRVLPLLAKIQNFTPLAILCGCTALFGRTPRLLGLSQSSSNVNKIKGTDQLRGYNEADQCLCFRYTERIFPLP